MTLTKDDRNKEGRAVILALAMAFMTSVVVAGALTIFAKPRAWVPILAGGAVGILTYALIAPEH